jgi:phytoene synthase
MDQLTDNDQLVRRFDRERFVTALFAPPARRDALMALYAFNVEVARVRESVTDPMAGMIRLQWWRDILTAVGEGRSMGGGPVVDGLAVALGGLDPAPLHRLLDARQSDLDPDNPRDLAAAEDYAAATGGGLAQMAARLLGADDEASQVAARHVGMAWVLLGHVRALGFHLSMGRLTWPEDLLRQAGTSGDAVRAGHAPKAALAAVAQGLGEVAVGHLARARAARAPKAAIPALLPAVLAQAHLGRLHRLGWDVFHPVLARSGTHPLRLAWANFRGKI